MYVNSQAVNIGYTSNISGQLIERLIQFKNRIRNLFKSKNAPKFDLIECFDNFSDLLFSFEPFRMEFTAFSNLRIIIEYIIDHNLVDVNIDFINQNFNLFFDLMESKIDLIRNNNAISQKEYDEQLEFYNSKILEYNSFFYENIYENTSEDMQDAISIGKILLNY